MSETYSFLGPAGTFTEMALRQAPEAQGRPWRAVNNVPDAVQDVVSGRSVGAMIAIENSIEGGVTASQDALSNIPRLRIRGEYIVPIRFSLAVRPGAQLEDVRTIAAHPVAYGQCRRWLAEALPHHAHLPAASNVASAAMLFDSSGVVDAAITPPTIREHLRVDIAAEDIQDSKNAMTRFVLVGLGQDLPARTGSDKTSIIVELPQDRPGALLEMLEQISTRGVNMSMITSRPIPESPGNYRFVIDLEGHLHDARVADALLGVRRFSPRVVFLGSYPRAGQPTRPVDPTHEDARFESAAAWLASLEGPDAQDDRVADVPSEEPSEALPEEPSEGDSA